ncbi:hypothetical protein [Streptomyces sp. NPDC088794]|uniref:hypothetical protein n=1 Tax=Streptomyces sp. NPDC088794 TaxID=3365902 RepID=UPI003815D47A
MNIIEAALTSFEEHEAAQPARAAEEYEHNREKFLRYARRHATRTLSEEAGNLDWQYTPADRLPESVEEATAILEPGRPDYLVYQYDYSRETATLKLVQPCTACGSQRVNPVDGYVTLGRLLTEAAQNGEQR